MITQHTSDDLYDHIMQWAQRVSEPLANNNGWPMCPYARKAIVNKTVKVWTINDYYDLELLAQTFENKPWAVEVVICPSAEFIDEWAQQINASQDVVTALADDPNTPGDIAGHNPSNGTYPVIILQDRKDLLSKRSSLKDTDYYSSWANWYLDYVLST